MKVILTRDIKGTGKKGQAIEVSDGFARNYLFPKELALEANSRNMNELKAQSKAQEHKKAEKEKQAQELAKSLDGAVVTITAKAGEGGRLFGSVTNMEIAGKIEEKFGLKLDKKRISLPEPIKGLGEYEAQVRLESAQCSIKVMVLPA